MNRIQYFGGKLIRSRFVRCLSLNYLTVLCANQFPVEISGDCEIEFCSMTEIGFPENNANELSYRSAGRHLFVFFVCMPSCRPHWKCSEMVKLISSSGPKPAENRCAWRPCLIELTERFNTAAISSHIFTTPVVEINCHWFMQHRFSEEIYMGYGRTIRLFLA